MAKKTKKKPAPKKAAPKKTGRTVKVTHSKYSSVNEGK